MINEVIQGDCLEVMKDIPDKSIDNGSIFSFRLKRGKRPYSKKSRSNKLKNKNYYHWWESD